MCDLRQGVVVVHHDYKLLVKQSVMVLDAKMHVQIGKVYKTKLGIVNLYLHCIRLQIRTHIPLATQQ